RLPLKRENAVLILPRMVHQANEQVRAGFAHWERSPFVVGWQDLESVWRRSWGFTSVIPHLQPATDRVPRPVTEGSAAAAEPGPPPQSGQPVEQVADHRVSDMRVFGLSFRTEPALLF